MFLVCHQIQAQNKKRSSIYSLDLLLLIYEIIYGLSNDFLFLATSDVKREEIVSKIRSNSFNGEIMLNTAGIISLAHNGNKRLAGLDVLGIFQRIVSAFLQRCLGG